MRAALPSMPSRSSSPRARSALSIICFNPVSDSALGSAWFRCSIVR
jgi:hypothetical protein